MLINSTILLSGKNFPLCIEDDALLLQAFTRMIKQNETPKAVILGPCQVTSQDQTDAFLASSRTRSLSSTNQEDCVQKYIFSRPFAWAATYLLRQNLLSNAHYSSFQRQFQMHLAGNPGEFWATVDSFLNYLFICFLNIFS